MDEKKTDLFFFHNLLVVNDVHHPSFSSFYVKEY